MSLIFLKDFSGNVFLGKEISRVVSRVAQGALKLVVLGKGREMLQEEDLDKALVAGISCLIPGLSTSLQTLILQSKWICSQWDQIDVPGTLGLCCTLWGWKSVVYVMGKRPTTHSCLENLPVGSGGPRFILQFMFHQ